MDFTFSEWLVATGSSPDFESLNVTDLNGLLRKFYAEVRNQKGECYSKSAYSGLRAAINRHLSGAPYYKKFDIIRDCQFKAANSIFIGQLRLLKQQGKDITESHKAIGPGDVKKMYSSGTLSNLNPISLQRKVFFETCLHFGRRGREGLRSLSKTSFVFKVDDQGREFATLNFKEVEKNHRGISLKETSKVPMMFAQNDKDCPVVSLKMYLSKLHPECSTFFQKPKKIVSPSCETWYCNVPLGKTKIEGFMKDISLHANLSSTYTNHCIRTTVSTVLGHAGVEARNICAITGHRNEGSLKSYIAGPSNEQRVQMSGILNNYGKENAQKNEIVKYVAPKEVSNLDELDTGSKVLCVKNDTVKGQSAFENSLGSLFQGAVIGGHANININLYTQNTSNN